MKVTYLVFGLYFISFSAFALNLDKLFNPSFRTMKELKKSPKAGSWFDYDVESPGILRTVEGPLCEVPFRPVPIGKHRMMKRDGYKSGNYLISRPRDKFYQAILNINFIPDPNPPVGKPGTEDLAQKILNRTKNCLKELRPYFRGPNGEELEIIILSSKDDMPMGMKKPDLSEIKVSFQDNSFRGDSANFGSGFECPVIGHEILHHVGLTDEYFEGVIQYALGPEADFSCRPVTAQNSLMRNMEYAYESTLPLTSRCVCDANCQKIMKAGGKAKNVYLSMNGEDIINPEGTLVAENNEKNPDRQICKALPGVSVKEQIVPEKGFEFESQNGNKYVFNSYRAFANEHMIFYDKTPYHCECRSHQPYCQKMMNELKRIAQNVPLRPNCPPFVPTKSPAPAIGKDPEGSRVECDGNDCDLIVTTIGSGRSLLSPSHFYKILGGNCTGGAPSYEACEKYSYMSGSDSACKKKPRECNDDNYFLNGILGQ